MMKIRGILNNAPIYTNTSRNVLFDLGINCNGESPIGPNVFLVAKM
jgi:hypothetical protein